MWRKSVVGVAAILVTALAGCAQSTRPPVDRDGPRSADRDAQLTAAFPELMRQASIPGAIVGVWQEGKPAYVRAFGVQDTSTGQPMTTDLHMRIGSLTKTFTVTALLLLAQQGKLGLDDPIDRYVTGVPSGDVITLRQLAAMRSGLFNYAEVTMANLSSEPDRQWTPQELLAVSFSRPLLFEPGTKFDYSNTNTVLLGLVVEKVSGQSIETFIDQHILKPERLGSTAFPPGSDFPSPHSQGYAKAADGATVNATNWNSSWGWAAGQMVSTLDDVRVWTQDLAMGKLLTPEMRRQRDQFLPAPEEGQGAQYGLAIENQNGWIGHNGNIAGFMTYPYYLPDEQTTMVVMLNSNVDVPGSWALMEGIVKIVSPGHPWPKLPTE
ncbi:serine hydrolase domain-containing protein [Catellatospora citrea]|uniref:Serine hydrolase n=1 Tax=Catellatospora citrea TaxID=53366 RepID=A0A8J3NZ38_9ACTN|nr:serine hydrolase domain-containing protein [Catellatospora citrea]RKE00405.1 D-alanyl-D-alanine carboxypeptidase [Catellatospora citrea]GIF98065.1 serine hydrolase [Catellatospora citrea]